ncbi:ABC transporter permease [Alteromonas aestuariivivens]|uniref:ABC transporter permease n=1 Tax=Alteromonas aestuariivivens TaxID=1938339 RepID=A0A3D8M8P0_9ALTE|nr:ABC transporter permease [Alteromonas aestuariivivens]RDV26048.1 ABC transporter permease [Alteromonas aestuariivivens]
MTTLISWQSLLWCLVPALLVAGIFARWCRDDLTELLVAVARMVVQLSAIGFVLLWLFQKPSAWISLAIMALMMTLAAWIAVRPLRRLEQFTSQCFSGALVALMVSVGIHLVLTLWLVLDVQPWYTPSFIIPLAGMYFANTMNTISLSAERYFAESTNSVPWKEARKRAFRACMIPQINGLLAVGLVALPGMMTGQILAGVEPLVAVRYQIMIMAMLLGATGVGAAIMLSWLGYAQKNCD